MSKLPDLLIKFLFLCLQWVCYCSDVTNFEPNLLLEFSSSISVFAIRSVVWICDYHLQAICLPCATHIMHLQGHFGSSICPLLPIVGV